MLRKVFFRNPCILFMTDGDDFPVAELETDFSLLIDPEFLVGLGVEDDCVPN